MSGPAPITRAEINQRVLKLVCDDLRIPPPSVLLLPGCFPEQSLRGTADWTNTIRVYLGVDGHDQEKLRFAQGRIVRTTLHELRHIHQMRHWSAEKWAEDKLLPYRLREAERDANEWAELNLTKYRALLTVKRTFPSSGFSRMSSRASRQVV